MKKLIYPLSIVLILFSSCQKNNVPDNWTITGTVFQVEEMVPEIQIPLEGIKIYLLDLDFSIDTVSGRYQQSDILDSVFTDTEGAYLFDQVNPGNYVVLPVDDSMLYQFDWSQSPDSIYFIAE